MIVNIRGANGSGKSTLVRKILDLHESTEIRTEGRSRPAGYLCKSQRPGCDKLLIPGSYETPTGGCDTLPNAELIYGMVTSAAEAGSDVLFEGIVAQHNTTKLLEICRDHRVIVIVLTTSQDDCVAAVRQRRIARGDDRPLDPKNVIKEWRSVQSSTNRLYQNGATVLRLDREEAFTRCLALLRGEVG